MTNSATHSEVGIATSTTIALRHEPQEEQHHDAGEHDRPRAACACTLSICCCGELRLHVDDVEVDVGELPRECAAARRARCPRRSTSDEAEVFCDLHEHAADPVDRSRPAGAARSRRRRRDVADAQDLRRGGPGIDRPASGVRSRPRAGVLRRARRAGAAIEIDSGEVMSPRMSICVSRLRAVRDAARRARVARRRRC